MNQWRQHLSRISLNCMEFLRLFLLIETEFFSVNSRDFFSRQWEKLYQCLRLITHNMMAKLRHWTNVWSSILGVSCLTILKVWLTYFLGHSFGITPPFIVLLLWPDFKLSMTENHQHYWHIIPMIRILPTYQLYYSKGIKSYVNWSRICWRLRSEWKKLVVKKRCEISFTEGQWVFVKVQPYRKHSIVLGKNQKLNMRYFVPFQIIQKIGIVAYKLSFLGEAKIHHPVFHVSLLKKCEGDPGSQANSIPFPLVTTEVGPFLQPIDILWRHRVLKHSLLVEQILVQWEGMVDSKNSWEDLDYMV